MANVRIDSNGIPKGAVFDQTAPVLHRNAVTTPDLADPASAAGGLATDGYLAADFDIEVTLGGADPLVEVVPLFYNPVAAAWFRGDAAFFTESGRYRLRAETRGAAVFLKVAALTGGSPTLQLSAWASLS